MGRASRLEEHHINAPDIQAAALSLNTIELRILVGACLNELKSRKQAGVPAKVVSDVKAIAPKAIAAAPVKTERPIRIVCEATGKTLKRAYSDATLAAQAAADLTAKMGRTYLVTGL